MTEIVPSARKRLALDLISALGAAQISEGAIVPVGGSSKITNRVDLFVWQ